MPHQVCKECGYYKGIKVLRTKTDRMHERGKILQEKRSRVEQQSLQKSSSEPTKTSVK